MKQISTNLEGLKSQREYSLIKAELLEINIKKIWKILKYLKKINSTPLNKLLSKEVTKEIKKYFELNENNATLKFMDYIKIEKMQF